MDETMNGDACSTSRSLSPLATRALAALLAAGLSLAWGLPRANEAAEARFVTVPFQPAGDWRVAALAGIARDGHASRAAPPDSLARTAETGDVLVVRLPDAIAGRPVRSYAPLRAPSMSWAAGRSFLWRTDGARPGLHRILLAATPADTTASAPDTLVLRVTLK
jgi:hypothetical protein